jgi:hypothetical protein
LKESQDIQISLSLLHKMENYFIVEKFPIKVQYIFIFLFFISFFLLKKENVYFPKESEFPDDARIVNAGGNNN